MRKFRIPPVILLLAVSSILAAVVFSWSFFSSSPCEYSWQAEDNESFSAESTLDKGIYTLTVGYRSDGYGILVFDNEGQDLWSSDTANALLPPYTDHIPARLYVNAGDTTVTFHISPAQEDAGLQISEIHLERMRMLSAAYPALRIFILALIIGGILLLLKRSRIQSSPARRVVFSLAAITLLSSIGFLIGYLAGGQDVEFHLGRIAGIADGLHRGEFPVRMYPYFENDYGYPLGILYGDLFLYPSALLHLLGVPLWKCYVVYAVLMNGLTALLSWLAFREITKNETAGLFGSAVYSLSCWRMIDMYIRAAAGEYAAMAFLPLVAAGFWLLLEKSTTENTPDASEEKHRQRKAACFLVIGYTGILQSHLLTSLMVSLFAALICLCCIRRLLRHGRLKTLILSAVSVVLLNLGFLVPFLDLYTSVDLTVKHQNLMIQAEGAYPAQLILPAGDPGSTTFSLRETLGMNGEMPMYIGILFFLLLLLTLYLALTDKETADRRLWMILGGFSLLSLWMSTCYFPYDALADMLPPLSAAVNAVQFPWRYLVIATLLLSVAAAVMIKRLLESAEWDRHALLFSAAALLLSVLSAFGLISDKLGNESVIIRPLSVSQIMSPLIDNDLLYRIQGMENEIFSDRSCHPSEGITVNSFARNGIDCLLQADNPTGSDGYIDLPLTAYGKFRAQGPAGTLSLSESDEHRVRVMLPAGFSGNIKVFFSTPLLWHMAALLSLLLWILAILFIARQKFRKTVKTDDE